MEKIGIWMKFLHLWSIDFLKINGKGIALNKWFGDKSVFTYKRMILDLTLHHTQKLTQS